MQCLAFAQNHSIAEILSSDEFIYAIGRGQSFEEADVYAIKALDTLTQTIYNQRYYLGDSKVICIRTSSDGVQCLRYIEKNDVKDNYKKLTDTIERYLRLASYENSSDDISEAARLYSWARLLTKEYGVPKADICNFDVDGYNEKYIRRELERRIDFKVREIVYDKTNTDTPYLLYVDVLRYGKPVQSLDVSYFNGERMTEGVRIKDGKVVFRMTKKMDSFRVSIDCAQQYLAKSVDPSVALALISDEDVSNGLFTQSEIQFKPKRVKIRKSPKVIPQSTIDGIDDTQSDIEPKYQEVLDKIVQGISSDSIDLSDSTFTEEAWDCFIRIVGYKPILVSPPQWYAYKNDGLLVCHGLTVQKQLQNGREVVENVVFRLKENDGKVMSVACGFPAKEEYDLMTFRWPLEQKCWLKTLVEDFITACTLGDMEYLSMLLESDESCFSFMDRTQVRKKTVEPGHVLYVRPSNWRYARIARARFLQGLKASFRYAKPVYFYPLNIYFAKGYNRQEGFFVASVEFLHSSECSGDMGQIGMLVDSRTEEQPVVYRTTVVPLGELDDLDLFPQYTNAVIPIMD